MSPVFEKEGCDHILKRTVILPATKRVASIQAEDNKNRKIDSYNPRMGKFDGALFTLEEDSEIIGVYGVMGKRDHITSLGFLVKKENVWV